MIVNTHYAYCGAGGVPGERATIVVTAPTGSTVTATLGETVLRASEVSGTWTFNVKQFGVWTINATKDGQSANQQVNVTEDTTYSVNISYVVYYTVRITGSGKSKLRQQVARVTINGIQYSAAATLSVASGTVVELAVRSTAASSTGVIKVNGRTVKTNSTDNFNKGAYTLAIGVNRNIALSVVSDHGEIAVT